MRVLYFDSIEVDCITILGWSLFDVSLIYAKGGDRKNINTGVQTGESLCILLSCRVEAC
jgi:hypothetical protein